MMRSNRVGLALLCLALVSAGASAQGLRFNLNIRGNFTPQGMVVQAILPNSEADRAGLRPGDVIVKIDGVQITNQTQLAGVINSSGGALVLQVRRRSGRMDRLNLDLTGGVRQGGGPPAPYLLGVAGLFRPQGMLVKAVLPRSPAATAGLQQNDFIFRINNLVPSSQADLLTILNNSGGRAVLEVRRASGRQVRLTARLKLYELGVLGDYTPQGMRVRVVAPGTGAEIAGLQPGDFIVGIDGKPIRNQDEFDSALRRSGGSVVLFVRKGPAGTPVRLPVELVNNPLGVWCEPANEGLRILSVSPGGSAAQIGLERGDVILKVDTQRVRSNRDLKQALKLSAGLATIIVRKGETGRLVRLDATLGW
jgi:S1-C subfamily serine protease